MRKLLVITRVRQISKLRRSAHWLERSSCSPTVQPLESEGQIQGIYGPALAADIPAMYIVGLSCPEVRQRALMYTDDSLLFRSSLSSDTQSCPTLCDPMNCSTPGLPVHHQLSEFTQTHVHRVGDAIQPSRPLSSFCPQSLPASGSFPMSQLFASGGQSVGVSASTSVLPMNTQD